MTLQRVLLLSAVSIWALSSPRLVNAFTASVSTTTTTSSVRMTSMDDTSEWYSPPPPPKVVVPTNSKALQTELCTHDDMESFLHGHKDDDRLVIIKYYASWCRTCAKVSRKLDLLAAQHADWVSRDGDGTTTKQGSVRIATVEYMTGRELCAGIEKLPTIRMFLPNPTTGVLEQVQEFACPPSQFQRLTDLVKGYVQQQQLRKEEEELSEALTRGHAMIQQSLGAADLASSTNFIAAANPAGGRRARLWKRLQRSH